MIGLGYECIVCDLDEKQPFNTCPHDVYSKVDRLRLATHRVYHTQYNFLAV